MRECSLLALAGCYKQRMIRLILHIASLALIFAFYSTGLTAERCKDCGTAPDPSGVERARDGKRIAEELVGRPWDGTKPGLGTVERPAAK
jgi:hypothetical protein